MLSMKHQVGVLQDEELLQHEVRLQEFDYLITAQASVPGCAAYLYACNCMRCGMALTSK